MGWSRKEKNGDHFIYDSIFRMGMSVTAKIFKTQTSYHKTNTTPHLQKVIDKNFYAALRFWERNFHSLCKRRDSFPKFSAEFYLKNLAFRFLLIFAVFISFPLLGAQTILLKNGTSLKGDVTGQNEKVITVRTADGETQTISKRSILKVIYRDVNEDEAKRIRQEEEIKIQEAKSVEDKKKIEDEAIRSPFETKTTGSRNRWSLVWRSAVFPGWGHYKSDRKKIGIVYGSLFWSGVILTLIVSDRVGEKKSEYENSARIGQISDYALIREMIVHEKRSEYKKSIDDYQNLTMGTVLVYLIQLTHSYFTGIDWEKEEIAITPQGSILKKGIQLDSMKETNFLNSESRAFDWKTEVRYSWFF